MTGGRGRGVRYILVRARLRPGERLLTTKEGVRLLEWNLGRPKCRLDSALYAYRITAQGIELVLGVPHPQRLTKIMHRLRVITVTFYNRRRGAVGTQRWQRGFESHQVKPKELAKAARRVGRPRGGRVALDPLPARRPTRRSARASRPRSLPR